MKKIYFYTLLLFCLGTGNLKAQQEFLVTVNPTTGIDSIIDSIPGVHFILDGATTFDKNHHRYIFLGIDFSGNHRLYCINALTGAIISQPIDTLNLGELHYDNANDSLYGLCVNNMLAKMYLVSIHIPTGSINIVDTMPTVGYAVGSTFLDESGNIFVLQSATTFYVVNFVTKFIVVGAGTTAYNQLEFDNIGGLAYGLVMLNTPNKMILVSIPGLFTNYTVIDTLPTVGYSDNQTSFNEINHVYTFSMPDTLYSVNTNTDMLVSSPYFPVGITPPQNVIELHYDNSTGILYALHWGPSTDTSITTSTNKLSPISASINVYPNPSTGIFTIALSHPELVSGSQTISVYNVMGQEVTIEALKQIQVDNTINLSGQPSGVYLYRVLNDDGTVLGSGKLIVQK